MRAKMVCRLYASPAFSYLFFHQFEIVLVNWLSFYLISTLFVRRDVRQRLTVENTSELVMIR